MDKPKKYTNKDGLYWRYKKDKSVPLEEFKEPDKPKPKVEIRK